MSEELKRATNYRLAKPAEREAPRDDSTHQREEGAFRCPHCTEKFEAPMSMSLASGRVHMVHCPHCGAQCISWCAMVRIHHTAVLA